MAKTRVVHYRDRAKYDPEQCEYIGRAMRFQKLKASPWANPYKITADCDREQAIALYRAHLESRLREDPRLWEELAELSGKVLLCWCCPKEGFQGRLLCHGQILAEFADLAASRREGSGDARS